MASEQSSGRSRFRLAAVLVLGLAGLAVATGVLGTRAAEEASDVVATIQGASVLLEEIESEAVSQFEQIDLQKLQCEIKADRAHHDVLESQTQNVVRRKLLDLEAAERGLTSAALRAEVRSSAASVTQADIDQWWDVNKNRVNEPKKDVEEQVRLLLQKQAQQGAESKFYEELEERYEVAYLVEPFRSNVASEGFPAFGSEDAPVTIVEFSDFECPYCARVLPTIRQIKSRFGDEVKFVFRQYPLDIHSNARKAAEASLCARDQGKFWEMHDLLFAEQKQLAVAQLKSKAGRLGMDQDSFDECLDSGRYAADVATDIREGSTAGVSGTPAMFVNGRLVSGAVPFETIKEVIDDELRRSN